MKIVVIHGQSHEGSTCMIARQLAKKIVNRLEDKSVLQEFFLPRDFNEPCRGCCTCFMKDLKNCPHYKQLQPIINAILETDVLIMESPVYIYHATGQMMSLLDHFASWWIVHRPRAEMTKKQAIVISTVAGGGMKRTCQDMEDSLEMWGIRKIYRFGVGVMTTKPDDIPTRIKNKIERKTDSFAKKIVSNAGKQGMNARARKWFYILRFAHRHFETVEADHVYWEEKGGYSYLVTDGEMERVLKQIHHEPCSYYTFGNKIAAEINDYKRLLNIGIRIPKLIDVDMENERIIKEYIEGETIYELVKKDVMKQEYIDQVKEMCTILLCRMN